MPVIPKITNIPVSKRYSFIYLEKGSLEAEGWAVVFKQDCHLHALPVGNTSVLMLGPGTSITQAAIRICSEERCCILWTGECGVRVYGAHFPSSENPLNLTKQVLLAEDSQRRLMVAKRLYQHMFGDEAPNKRSVNQLRGWEGSKVKKMYQELAAHYEVPWDGRTVSGKSPSRKIDHINQCLEIANSCLYALSEAVIIALGYSPAIGFIHRSNKRSFVFDIADCVKINFVEETIYSKYSTIQSPEEDVRIMARNYFKEEKVAERLVTIIEESLSF